MPRRTRRSTKLQNTPKDDEDDFGSEEMEKEDQQAAAGRCTKICETIYVGGRQGDVPSSPTQEAETIHVAGYEVDDNPLLEENGMADSEVDTALLDAQDGESGSNGITSPAGSYERVANTMEGVEHGEGEATPLICRAGSNNLTEGDNPVQNTIAGNSEVVDQLEANVSTGTGTETGNISLPDSCDEQDQQEIGVHLESDIHKGNRDCSKQRDQTFAAKGTNQESYMNQRSLVKDGVEDHTPPEMNGTHFARTSNVTMEKTIDNLSGSMAVNLSNMNRIADITFGSLTTVEGVTNPLIAADKMGKRLRETSTDVSSPELRARDESPTRKRRRVMEDLKKKQQSEEVSVPTNWGDERNIVELDGMGVLCGVDTGTGKVETDKQNSDTNLQEVRSDGEVEMAISEGKTNNGQSNTEKHAMEISGTVESASLKADTDRRNSDSDMHEVGRDPDVDMACPAETADNEPREPQLDGMESSGEVNPRSCEVETGKPINDTNMQEVRGDSEVGRAFPEGKNNNGQSNTELQDMKSSGSVDYPSRATGTNKQNCDTNMSKVGSDIEMGSEEMGGDTEAYMAISWEKTNDEQTNPELGVMESSGSVDNASLNTDTERQNRDSDMHEEQRKAEKLVVDVDSPLRSATKKNGQLSVHIDAAQSLQSGQMGNPNEPEAPLKQKENFMNFARISREDNLRRMELERYSVARLEMKHAKLLIDMIDSLFNRKADMYYLLAFKMVLLIFPYTAWEHVRDRLPAMMSYATEDIKTGLEKRLADEVYTEYPSDKGVDERIICWNQRLELYKGIEHGTKTLLEPTSRSVRTCVGRRPSESSSLQADIQEMAGDLNHCQKFQDYFSHYASRTAFIFQNPQLLRDEIRTLVKENMGLKDAIGNLEKLQKGKTEEFESQLRDCNKKVVALGEKNDEMENDFRLLYLNIFAEDLPPSLEKPSDIIWEKLEKEFKKRCNIEQEQVKLLEKEKALKASLEAESRKQYIRIQQLEQEFENVSQSLRQEQVAHIEAERSKSDIQAQLDAKTQSLSTLEYQFQQANKEKVSLKDKNDELKTQVEGIENWYKCLEAKLLPIDQDRKIQNWGVNNNSTQSDKDTQTNDSDGFAGDSMPRLKEDLAAVKAQVKNKEENLTAVEQEKAALSETIKTLEEDIRTGRDQNKTAHNKINELEVQLDIKSMDQQKVVDMQAQIVQLEQEIKSIQEREQSYKATIDEYENQIKDINNWMETRNKQITEVQQYLKDAETEVREQKKALLENRQELEAVKAEASKKEENQKSIEQEKNRLKETMEKMEQTTNEKDKKVGILNVRLQDAEKEIEDLTTTLATVNATLQKERISTACEIGHLSKIIENLEKTKGEYDASIDDSETLKKRLREVEEERTAVMNVQDAIKQKEETISCLRQDIEIINEGHASEVNRLTEEVRKLNSQIEHDQKGDSGVTVIPRESLEFNDKSCAIPLMHEVALQELERWKESGDKLVESQERIDNQSASGGNANCAYLQLDSVAQAVDHGILTRLEIKVEDLKRAIDKQHIRSQDNVESNKICHGVEEMSKLISRVNQQSEESAERLCKEISRFTEQTSQLNSDIKAKDKQYREPTNELLAREINYEAEGKRLTERLPVLEIEQLKKQIHELHEQVRALGPELKDKSHGLGTPMKDVSDTKAKTLSCQGDVKHRDMIIESLPSDLKNIMTKLIEMEKAMTRQLQITCDERRNPSHFTSTRNSQLDESNNFSKLESQVNDLDRIIAQLREKGGLIAEVQKLQSSVTERDSKFNGLKDTMDWLVQEVGKLQRSIKDSDAEVHERQGDMARLLQLSSNAWINQKPAEEATSKLNGNHDRRNELDGLREELGQVEKNIMYFTSTFPPPSGQPFSAVMEERFLGKVPVTERLKLLIERVRHRIEDLQSSLEQAKLDYERVIRPERARRAFVPDANEVVTPLSELNMEFLTPIDRESGAIHSPTGQRQSRSIDGKHNADASQERHLPLEKPLSSLRSCDISASTQTGIQEASKESRVEGHGGLMHASTDRPMGSRKLEEEHALGSDSVRTDLERLRASMIFHLCTMLFASKRTVDVERLREGSRIFSRRTIGKSNLELLEQVIKGYSEQSMKNRGANKELRKITYKGRKAFPDTLLKTYTTIFKTLLSLTEHLDINDPINDSRSTEGEAARLDKGTKIQGRTRKPKRQRLTPAQPVKTVN
ncbi:hypothetical protein ACKRZS_006813 [Fusarium odoratissimum]